MNDSGGAVEIVSGKNQREEPIFAVVVKRTYRIEHGAALVRHAADEALLKVDVYHDGGDPQWATVRHEYELAAHKQGVDVVVIGKAYARGAQPIEQMTVGVKVGESKKLIVVTGDRSCIHRPNADPAFTDPRPFTEMDIRYERAYGGVDERSVADSPFHYPRNPMGVGVVLSNEKRSVEGLVLPNLEDPNDRLSEDRLILGDPWNWPAQPLPQGLGWYQRAWYPRAALLGAYPAYIDVDTVTPEERAGLLPKSHIALAIQRKLPAFQSRFNNGASIGMLRPTIDADEKIQLRGLSPEGELDFSLPGETPRVSLDIGSGPCRLEPRLDTVSICPDDMRVNLIWRASQVHEGNDWLPQMTCLHAEVE